MKTKTLSFLTGGALAALVFAGCANTPDTRIAEHPDVYAQLTPAQQAQVHSGQVAIGFDMETVKLALGDPDSVAVATDAHGQVQIWHYVTYGYYDGAYLYAGPYWGPHGRRRWGGGWGWGGGYQAYRGPVSVYDHFRIEFRDGKVVAFVQEMPHG